MMDELSLEVKHTDTDIHTHLHTQHTQLLEVYKVPII